MLGDYVLICKEDKWLIPLACTLIHSILIIISFSWRTNLQMFIGSIKHDVTITKIKLSCVSFAPHSRIFLVGGSSISTARTTIRNWPASLKFHGLELPRKCRCHGKAFRSLTHASHPKLGYPMKTRSWPLCVFWYSCFITRLNFLVSYSSDLSPEIFFICKYVGRS